MLTYFQVLKTVRVAPFVVYRRELAVLSTPKNTKNHFKTLAIRSHARGFIFFIATHFIQFRVLIQVFQGFRVSGVNLLHSFFQVTQSQRRYQCRLERRFGSGVTCGHSQRPYMGRACDCLGRVERKSLLRRGACLNRVSFLSSRPGASEQGVQGERRLPLMYKCGSTAPPVKRHLKTSAEPQTAPANLGLFVEGKMAKVQTIL